MKNEKSNHKVGPLQRGHRGILGAVSADCVSLSPLSLVGLVSSHRLEVSLGVFANGLPGREGGGRGINHRECDFI